MTEPARPIALVSGAGRMASIGRAVALELARAGHDVVVTGTGRLAGSPDEAAAGWAGIDSVADEVRSLGRRALPVVADVADEASVAELFERALAEFGRLDVVVNNAAAPRAEDRVPIVDLDAQVWDEVQRVNVRGTFLMSRAAARHMLAREARGASIVNMSSIAGKNAGPGAAAYSASKAAVQALTSSIARELGPSGIRVNAICPGVTMTGRLSDQDDDHWAAHAEASIPLRRLGTPDDIAAAVAFLVSDRASWITGQCWNVDGGQVTMR